MELDGDVDAAEPDVVAVEGIASPFTLMLRAEREPLPLPLPLPLPSWVPVLEEDMKACRSYDGETAVELFWRVGDSGSYSLDRERTDSSELRRIPPRG